MKMPKSISLNSGLDLDGNRFLKWLKDYIQHDYDRLTFIPSADYLVVEGTSQGRMSGKSWAGGKTPGGRFCNVFKFHDGRISSLHIHLDPDAGEASSATDCATLEDCVMMAFSADRRPLAVRAATAAKAVADRQRAVAPHCMARAAASLALAASAKTARASSEHLYLAVTDSANAIATCFSDLDHRYTVAANEIRLDFDVILESAQKQSWRESQPLPSEYFALHGTFDITDASAGPSILDVSSAVNERLIEYFRIDPKHLYELSPRQFEEVVAELFAGFGFEVVLTAPARDGGRDVVAVNHRVVPVKYLIECKRYSRDRRVGIAPVQRLYGVVRAEGATKGILATTAWYSSPAQKFLIQHEWEIEGRDFAGLVEWLDLYHMNRLAAKLRLK